MRGDGVGVGDVGAVPGGAWGSGHSASGDDGRGARRERDGGVLGGRGEHERDAATNRAGTGSASVTVHGAGWGWWRSRRWGGWGRRDARGRSGSRRRRCGAWWGMGPGHTAGGDDGGGAGGSVTQGYSVDAGSMSVMRRTNRAGTGSASVTVHGSGWGWWRSRRWVGWGRRDARGRSGSRRRRCGAWWGRGAGHTAGGDDGGGAGGSVTRGYSVDVGSMSVTRRSNRAGTGSASVTVHGSGWGWWRSRRWGGWGRRDARGRSGSRRRRCGAWWGMGLGAHGGW